MKSLGIYGISCFFALAPTASNAQNCTRGKRCGNTCISRSETCHVGGGDVGDDGDALAGLLIVGGVIGLIFLATNVAGRSRYHSTPGNNVWSPVDVTVRDDGGGLIFRTEW